MSIDTHAHLTSAELLPHIEEILQRADDAGIATIVNICTDSATLEHGLTLQKKYPQVFNAAATTPHDVAVEGERFFPIVEKAAREGRLIAIGETGLDYHYLHSPKETQKDFLKRYIALANKTHLPLIFHCRDAFGDLFSIATDVPHAVLHCFTGTLAQAREATSRGWFLSISGIATFKKSEDLREVIREIPLQHLLVETDAPYLAPQSRRGKLNEPSYVTETIALIATLKNLSTAAVSAATAANARTLFRFNQKPRP